MVVSGFDLSGKKALMVGAGSQVGRAISLALAEAGADVALTSCTTDAAEGRALEACAGELAGMGCRAAVLSVDVTSEQEVHRMVDEAVASLGAIDILVNNIDLPFAKPLVETTAEEWARTMSMNLTSVFLTVKHAAQHMLRRGKGKIVNVTSQLGERGLPNSSAYGAAKGGVVLLTKAAAQEWGKQGISVNAIGLGWMDGDALAQSANEELRSRLARYIPMQRMGQPDEVGPLAVYLASDASDFITGHTLYLDGGVLSRL